MSIKSHDLRTLEDMEAAKPRFGDTVIVIDPESLDYGNVGMITEHDTGYRNCKVMFRKGYTLWHHEKDLYAI